MRTFSTHTILSLLFIVGVLLKGFSQNTITTDDRYPKWRLGLNMGGTWQTNDIKKNYAGLAGGFNIERILNRRDDAPIGFSLGFRYLSGNTSGYDNRKNTALKFNQGLNGTNNPLAKYDSVPGFFYNNYFSHVAEGDLELKINFPAMEKKTHFIFHVFGGVGITKYKTRINALDDSTHVFDFTKLPPAPSVANVKSFYGSGNGKFETYADGNNKNGTYVFAPSLGIGIGYRVSKHVAFVVEHKVTFPFTNVLDGQQYATAAKPLPLKNDIYHYTALNLIFTIYGKHHASYNTTPNTTTTNTVNPQTDPTVYNGVNNAQPRPTVSIYSPNSNPYTTTTGMQQVTGVAHNISSAGQLNISINGSAPANGFSFNPNNGSFSFEAYLLPGNNNISVTATNNAGQDIKNLTINYSTPQSPIINNNPNTTPVTEIRPTVLITYPSNNYNTNTPSVNVNATVTNIASSSNIAISANGYAINNFNFNPYNGSVSFVAPLMQGNNSIIVSAFNSAGNDAQQVFVTYTPANQTVPVLIAPAIPEKPVVSFNNPSSSPFQSVTTTFNVTAKVTNVADASQVAVQYNGLPVTNFTFNQYGFVNFVVNLNTGSNTVVITASNKAGSDTKSATINYKEAGFPPVVTIVNPISNPASTYATATNVIATATNVADQSNITVLVNNAVSPFSYNTSNQTVTVPVTLNTGTNVIKISASNSFGSDSKTQTIERKEVSADKPVITVLSPGVSPFTTNATPANVVAQVTHVSGPKAISVVDGSNAFVTFSYNTATQQITFSPNLNAGANTFVISASNAAGSDTKSVTINYTVPKVIVPAPTVTIVNPASSPLITTDAQLQVKATTTNVAAQQEVTVIVNGVTAPFNFVPATKEVEVPVTLNIGTNTVTISVSNAGGSDSKTQIIERFTPPKVLLPVVTVMNPQTSPFLSPTSSYTVTAEILNVGSSADISVTQGTTQVAFNYDNSTHLVNFAANNLSNVATTYTIKGANVGGSDSKSVTLSMMKKIGVSNPVINKPVVTITNPGGASSSTTVPTQAISATITNISNASQVGVLVNGIATTNFAYVNGSVTLTANLNAGNNTITITGTNQAGSDSKSVSVVFTPRTATIAKPVVTITNPAAASMNVTSPSQNITATVTNVANASQVTVLLDGTSINNFQFNNGTVSFTANLLLGSNTITITGTNESGSDSKSVLINYSNPRTTTTTLLEKPVVTFTSPATASSTASSAAENITATVTNVIGASQVSVLVNGVTVPNFNYSNGNVSFTANLNQGNNTVSVTGTNSMGSDSKTITIQLIRVAGNNNMEKPVVMITTPTTVNSTVYNATQAIVATVTNVLNASQVNVSVNGTPLSNFNFSNGNVTFTANLNIGNNTVTVIGTNVAGTDSKTVGIQFIKASGNTTMEKPIVTIVTPGSINTTVNQSTQAVSATITNVVNASEVSVQVNGTSINNFSFNNGTVNFTANLNLGGNSVKVTGTNMAGSDSKTVFINYAKPRGVEEVGLDKPVVTFINPSAANSTANNASQAISATVTNVVNANQVSVTVNGSAVNNFNFTTGSVNFTANLNIGNNTVTITGTNASGSDSKTITINYVKSGLGNVGNLSPKPVVTITSNNQTTPNSTQTVTANIAFISSSSQVSISANGAEVNSFIYNNGNVSFDANLNYGNNTIVVTGTNTAGSDSKTVTIFRKTPPAPYVTIVNPASSPTKTNKKDITVTATVQNVSSSNEITVTSDAGGNVPFSYNSNTFTLTFSYTLPNTYTTFTVSANNAGGSDSKTVTFKYEELARGTGTTDLITICHFPDGPNSTPQTIQIPTSEWSVHQAHGDHQGPCTGGDGQKPGTTTTPKVITTPKIEPKTTPTPTVTPQQNTTPKTVESQSTPQQGSTPRVIQPKKEETLQPTTPSNGPAPRVLQPR